MSVYTSGAEHQAQMDPFPRVPPLLTEPSWQSCGQFIQNSQATFHVFKLPALQSNFVSEVSPGYMSWLMSVTSYNLRVIPKAVPMYLLNQFIKYWSIYYVSGTVWGT